MEDTLQVTAEEQTQQDPPSKKLYNGLIEEKLYSKSYDDFLKQYSTPESRKKLHSGLVEEQLYSKGEADFEAQYFPAEVKKKEPTQPLLPSSAIPSASPAPKPEPAFSLKSLAPQVPAYEQGNRAISTQSVQPKVTATYQDFKLHNEEYKAKKAKLVDQAIENTARKYLKKKGVIKPEQEGKALNLSEYMQMANEKKRLKEAVESGDATFAINDAGEIGLKKTTGWWENLRKGWNESMKASDDAAKFANEMTSEEKLAYLKEQEAEQAKQSESEYLGERGSAVGSLGKIVGENAPFLIKAGEGAALAAGLIAAAPETLGASLAGLPAATAFIFTAEDSKNQGIMAEVSRRYYALKNEYPNADEVTLMQQAEQGALAGGLTGILTNAALMTSAKTPLSLSSKNVVGKAVTKAIGTTVYGSAATAGLEGLKVAEGALEGIKTTPTEIAKEMGTVFSETATTLGILHVVTGAATGAFRLPKMVRSAMKYALKDVKPETLSATLKINEEAGRIPAGTTDKVMAELASYNAAAEKAVDGLTPEVHASVAGLIEAKENLIAEMKTKDDSAKPYYDEKIEGINEQINKTINTGKPFLHEVDEISGTTYTPAKDQTVTEKVKSKVDEVKVVPIREALRNADEPLVNEILKEVSDQWHDEGTRAQTERDYGKTITEEAVKMFPQESKKSLSVPVTPEGFSNRIHEGGISLGSPTLESHVTEKGYTYRSLGDGELAAIAETGGVFAREGKQKGGNSNTKYWSSGDGKFFYRPDQKVIRVKNENISKGEVVSAKDLEVWDQGKNEFVPFETAKEKSLSVSEPSNVEKQSFKVGDQDTFFHASSKPREGRLKEGTAANFGKGVYFSTNKETVKSEFGENVTEAKLDLDNPVHTNTPEWTKVQQLAIEKADKAYGEKKGLKLEEDETYFRYDKENLSEIDEINAEFISDAAKELGYDAIIDKGSKTYDNEILVLDQSKIKYPEDSKSPTKEASLPSNVSSEEVKGDVEKLEKHIKQIKPTTQERSFDDAISFFIKESGDKEAVIVKKMGQSFADEAGKVKYSYTDKSGKVHTWGSNIKGKGELSPEEQVDRTIAIRVKNGLITEAEGEQIRQSIFEKSENKPTQANEGEAAKVPVTEKESNPTDKATYKDSSPTEEGSGGKEPPAAETVNVPVGDGKEKIQMTHGAFDKIASELGLDGYKKSPQSVPQWHRESDARISNGELPELLKRLKNKETEIDAVEQFMLGKYVAGLKFEYEKTGSDAVLKEIKEVMEYSNLARSEAGRVLRAGQEFLPVHPLDADGLASAMVAKMENNQTDVLTEAQKAEVKEQVAEYKKKAEAAEQLIAEMEQKHQETLAQMEIDRIAAEAKKGAGKSKSTTPKTEAEKRQVLKDKLKQQFEEYKAAGKKMGISSDGGAESFIISAKMAKTISEIAQSHIVEGVNKLADVVKKVHEEIKGMMPEMTERDIRDVIAGKYNEKKASKNELKATWWDLKQEQKLLDEYDRVSRGEPKTERDARKKNETLTKLRILIDAKKLEQTKAEKYEQNIKEMEAELERVRLRRSKEKVEKGSPKEKELTEQEQELQDKIEAEQEAWDAEKDAARTSAAEYKKLETERNRQLKRVGDLKEKLATLEKGQLPPTDPKAKRVDTPEIEALKKEIEVAEKKVRADQAHAERMKDLEAELTRIKDRKEKVKKPQNKRVLSSEEQLKRDEIEAEQRAWDTEQNIEKLNEDLQRVKDRKEKATTPKQRKELSDAEKAIEEQIKEEKKVWAKELEPAKKLRHAVLAAEKSLAEYERRIAEKDTEPKAKSSAPESKELTDLKTKVTEARKRYKVVREETGAASAQKLRNMIAANNRAAAKLMERIATEDFAPEKPKTFFENFELRRQHPELYNKVINAIHEKEEARLRFDIALAQDAASKEGVATKWYNRFGKVKNTLQQLAAGVDDSLMFVQLGFTLLRNPSTAINLRRVTKPNGKPGLEWGGALKEHVLDAWSKDRFNRNLTALHNSPVWDLIKASELDVLEPQSLLAQKKDEMFQHSYAPQIGLGTINMGKSLSLGDSKLKRANLGKFLEIWERAYTSLGNNTRIDLFTRRANEMYKEGMTIENNLAEFKGLAKAINNLTARGTTNAKIAPIIPFVTPVIWSPKMIASSINLLGLSDITGKGAGFYSKLPPKARRYAISQMAGGIGIGVSLLTAMAAVGYTVHYDPRDPQFGDVDYGDNDEKSFNVFGRFAGYIKLIAQVWPGFLYGGKISKDTGEVESMYSRGGKKGGEVVGTFFRGKMNPVSGLGYDYLLNDKTGYYDNKPITPGIAAKQLAMPMSLRDVKEELDRDGTIALLTYTLPNFVGIGMKDRRDYDDPAFSAENNTFLRNSNLKIKKPNKAEGMSDEDYEKYLKRRNERVEHDLKQLQEKGLDSGDKDPAAMEEAVKQIVSWANEIAKFETIKGTPDEQPKKPQIIKGYKPMDVKQDW